MILPAELKKKEFSKVLKGYSAGEVDEYISYLLTRYSEAYKEYAELEKRYKATLLKLEEAKSEENMFSELVLDARKMADAIVKDANDKAKAIQNAVSESCDTILNAYRDSVAAERDKLAETARLAKDFKESLFAAYREHIAAVERILPDEDPDTAGIAAATDDELVDSALDLAGKKYNDGVGDDADILPQRAATAEPTAENTERDGE